MDHGSADWIATEIEVRIKETHDDPSLIHQIGVIRNTSVSIQDQYVSPVGSLLSILITNDICEIAPQRFDELLFLLQLPQTFPEYML